MNLLDLAVKITCDDQASGEVDKIGDGIKNKLGVAAKAGVAAVAAVGTATIAIGKTALDAYSNYEQLVGGIDTLFKASSGKMQQYAANAYQTAGVSANRYMEISTSFAAALISSLGGNTEAAADMANTAITDMSDNANKMGTSLETVQEAYMSLSRGNYEMLDSLKLGYGGTKSELERLLSDAEKFSAAQGRVRDFSVDSYSDIVEAIHIVQDEMGITGTTAEEAATTIEGSINMMSAAWDNWLTGLGSDDADMGALTDQLVSSLDTVAKNIAPRVGIILSTLGEELVDRGPELAQQIGDMLIEAFTGAFNLVAGIIGENTELPTFEIDTDDAYKALDKLAHIFNTVKDAAGKLVVPLGAVVGGIAAIRAASKVVGIIEGLQAAFTTWRAATEGMTIAQIALNAVMNANPFILIATVIGTLVAAFVTLMATNEDFRNAVINAWNQIAATAQTVWGAVVNFFTVTIPQAIQSLVAWFAQLPGDIAGSLSTVIANVAGWVANMASNAVNAGAQFVSGIAGFLSALPGQVASWLSGTISTVVGWVTQFASNATSAASQFGSKLRSGLEAIPGTLGNIGANIVQGLVNGVTGAAGRLVDAVRGAVNNAIQGAKNLLGIKSPSRVFRKIGQYVMQGAALGVDDDAGLLLKSTDDAMRGMISTAQDVKYTPDVSGVAATASVVEWLDRNLGDVIANRTPYIGMRDFDRLARKAVAHA